MKPSSWKWRWDQVVGHGAGILASPVTDFDSQFSISFFYIEADGSCSNFECVIANDDAGFGLTVGLMPNNVNPYHRVGK